MIATELDRIKGYWTKKYPSIDVRLWSHPDNSKYYGQIINYDNTENFNANTIGELINLGENYLRALQAR